MNDWDADGNGIPDSIQRDPEVVPPEPVQFFEPPAEPGLPRIDAPIEPTADATPTLPEQPVMPTAPAADAGPADYERYQREMERYSQQMQMLSNLIEQMSETNREITRNIR